jgi:hypothetical protein
LLFYLAVSHNRDVGEGRNKERDMASTENAQRAECKRPGCKGILRTGESIARGMSKACDRKVRQAEAIAAAAGGYSADQQAKAAAAIRSGLVTIEAPGLYGIPSSKNDGTRYASDGASCCCPAGARDRRCWHLLVAIVIGLATPAQAARPASAGAWAEMDRLTEAFMAAA